MDEPIGEEKKHLKFKTFKVDKYVLPHDLQNTCYLRIKLSILYGCFELKTLTTKPFLIADTIFVNERIIFDTNFCLISHLPLETRIGITLQTWDRTLQKEGFVLGSCQIPLYRDTGEIQSGYLTYTMWPNVAISPRVNNSTPFMYVPLKFRQDDNSQKLKDMEQEYLRQRQENEQEEPVENIPEVEGGVSYEKKEMKLEDLYDSIPGLKFSEKEFDDLLGKLIK